MDDRRCDGYPEGMTELAAPGTAADLCCPGTDCELLAKDRAEDLARVFKALADPTRVRLLRYLAESESGTACACHLPTALEISQPTLSFHMRKLHYTVRPQALEQVRGFLDLQVETATGRCC
jgi:ArsR family transcriptional regulator